MPLIRLKVKIAANNNAINICGKKLISQIHLKEDQYLLGEGDIDFPKVVKTLDKIGYNGWLIVESSAVGDWRESQTANAQYVKKLIGK